HGLRRKTGRARYPLGGAHAGGKNVHRNFALAATLCVECEKKECSNGRVAERNAADGDIASVNKNVATRALRIRANPVGRVGIIQTERKMVKALRIEPVDDVKAFRHLAIAFAPFRAWATGRCDDRPRV